MKTNNTEKTETKIPITNATKDDVVVFKAIANWCGMAPLSAVFGLQDDLLRLKQFTLVNFMSDQSNPREIILNDTSVQ
jgi:hypothetical protein